jgi:hypothetical protein
MNPNKALWRLYAGHNVYSSDLLTRVGQGSTLQTELDALKKARTGVLDCKCPLCDAYLTVTGGLSPVRSTAKSDSIQPYRSLKWT